jgi:LacI family transcriptional regulator
MKKSGLNIYDVAKRAGVAISTVSKYLNNAPYVSEKAKKKIQAAIDELNYVPNSVARSLAKQQTGYLGLLIPEINNPFYMDLVQAIETEAAGQGYYLLLANTNGNAEQELKLARDMGSRVDGIIFSSITNDSSKINQLLEEGNKLLMVSRHLTDVSADYVVIDGFAGAKMAVDHLIRLGHRKIGHIGGSQSIVQFQLRYAGFQESLRLHGIPERADWVVFGEPTIQMGFRLAVNLMSMKDRPTALFVGNDNMAMGVLEACDIYGWDVPNDLALVGFDNNSFSRLALVPLTTVDSRIVELGQLAVQVMLEKIRGEDNGVPKKVILPPSLVVRRSCGANPRNTPNPL